MHITRKEEEEVKAKLGQILSYISLWVLCS